MWIVKKSNEDKVSQSLKLLFSSLYKLRPLLLITPQQLVSRIESCMVRSNASVAISYFLSWVNWDFIRLLAFVVVAHLVYQLVQWDVLSFRCYLLTGLYLLCFIAFLGELSKLDRHLDLKSSEVQVTPLFCLDLHHSLLIWLLKVVLCLI